MTVISKQVNKNIQKAARNQQIQGFQLLIGPLTPKERASEVVLFIQRSGATVQLLNHLIFYIQKYNKTYVSQGRLARDTGYSRWAANKAVGLAHELGFVDKENRGVKRTCIYRLAPWVLQPDALVILKEYLPALARVLVLGLLLSNSRSHSFTLHNEYIGNNPIYRCLQKQRSFMKALPTYLKKLTEVLPLTEAGLVEFAGYPETVISDLIKNLKTVNQTTVTNPFTYALGIGNRLCKEKGILPARKLTSQLKHALNITETEPKLRSVTDNEAQVKYEGLASYDSSSMKPDGYPSHTTVAPDNYHNGKGVSHPYKPYVHTAREYIEEDPFTAVTSICKNLMVDTVVNEHITITKENKRRVAVKDPWFDKLTTDQKGELLTMFPFYADVVGLHGQRKLWEQLHAVKLGE